MSVFVKQLDLGASTGLRVAVKDTIDIAGLPTAGGSRALAHTPAAKENAAVVVRALAKKCRIVGKTTMHELAFGITGINDYCGTPLNERYPTLIPGGSSSGSAVSVAQGLVDFALGTDTGGSIRFPAACCGVWGLKPTFGRVSRKGILPALTTLDCVGPFADSLEMIEEAMAILDPAFEKEAVSNPRIGIVRVDAEQDSLTFRDEFLERAGVKHELAELPLMEEAFAAGLTIINSETHTAFGGLIATGLLGRDVEARLKSAGNTTPADVERAERIRAAFTSEIDELLEEFDALLLPTIGDPIPTVEDARNGNFSVRLTRFVRPFNLSGHPALACPVKNAIPTSLQLVGRKGRDEQVCAVAHHLFSAH